jgi:hypothetical protein
MKNQRNDGDESDHSELSYTVWANCVLSSGYDWIFTTIPGINTFSNYPPSASKY